MEADPDGELKDPGVLSLPFADWIRDRPESTGEEPLDAVVIGSGYGGSVAALRLTQMGRRVTVFERGSEFLPGEFPNTIGQVPKFVRLQGRDGPLGSPTGLFEARVGQGLAAMVANGLGGGSLINAGVMMQPDGDVFAQPAWPASIRHASDARQANAPGREFGLAAAFDRADEMLGAQSMAPMSDLPKARALHDIGAALGRDGALGKEHRECNAHIDFDARPVRATIDVRHCLRCGDCASGCNVPGAKTTLRSTYLRQAFEAGAELVARCTVYALEPADGLWRLQVFATEQSHHARRLSDVAEAHGKLIHARVVVVSAGTFGSTELLMRSRDRSGRRFALSPALGTRLSGNGDGLSVLSDLPQPVEGLGHGADEGNEPPPPAVGPTITTVLDLRRHPAVDQRVVMQEGAVPGALLPVYGELLASAWAFRHLGRWRFRPPLGAGGDPLASTPRLPRHTQLLLTMGHDGSAGRLVWLPEMDGVAAFWQQPERSPGYLRQQRLFDAAERKTGAAHLHNPVWRWLPEPVAQALRGELSSPAIVTVHPLGGCPMADHFDDGVVDDLGRVHKAPHEVWPGLLVLDGSIIPTSLGCNPLWTIAALAERAMARLETELRGPPQPPRVPQRAVGRTPSPFLRQRRPVFDIGLHERLEARVVTLRGALREAIGREAECDLELHMRGEDWAQVWWSRDHRLSAITGRLRLRAAAARTEVGEAQPRQVEYAVEGGHVDLLRPEALWPVIAGFVRAWRFVRVWLTWWWVRGRRDRVPPGRERGWLAGLRRVCLGARMLWPATEHRRVDYALRLKRSAGEPSAPEELLLRGVKCVRYGATVRELCIYAWKWRRRKVPSAEWQPPDLRESLQTQLTCPDVRLDLPGALRLPLPPRLSARLARQRRIGRHLPASVTGLMSDRLLFDTQEALSRSPFVLHGSGDTTEAAAALLSYPALAARFLLRSRLFDFRAPNYSGRPLLDEASDTDVALRPRPGQPDPSMLPQEYPLVVPRGLSSSDDGSEDLRDVDLRLWRYQRRDGSGALTAPEIKRSTWCGRPVDKARSVLLMHAFDMSGYSFTFKETARNFAEYLYDLGYEVWILDSRMSPRTRAAAEPSTVDQIGLLDAPAAVDFIIETLKRERPAPALPLQIFAFGQCVGAAALLIGLLSGRLSHADAGPPRDGYIAENGEVPVMPKLAGLVTSQVHPFIVGARESQARTGIARLARDLYARAQVPLGLRSVVVSPLEAAADRLFSALSVPPGERCHGEHEAEGEDDACVTCRRVRFLLGGLWMHRNLNRATHDALPKLFGAGNARLFAQGAKFMTYERLCSEDGFNFYVTDAAIGRYLALPLRFVHGEQNGLFDKESAVRSAAQYARIHPRWVGEFGRPGPAGAKAVCDVIAGVSHLDVLIAKDAAKDARSGGPGIYARLSELLELAWRNREASPTDAAGDPAPPTIVVRFPKAGPWVGPPTREGGSWGAWLAFVVDDDWAELTAGIDAGACVVFRNGAGAIVDSMRLDIVDLKLPSPTLRYLDLGLPRPALRVARGRIRLAGGPVRGECFSYTFTTADGDPMDFGPVLQGGMQAPAADPPDYTPIETALAQAVQLNEQRRRRGDRPYPDSLSDRATRPPGAEVRFIDLPASALDVPPPGQRLTLAVGCCRYGGFPFDRKRADAAFGALEARLDREQPQALLMLGDQIYADRTAGLADEASPVERFLRRHQDAYTTPNLRRLLRRLPSVSLPDDHEFTDSYPLGRPLFRGRQGQEEYARRREREMRVVARRAVRAYQLMHQPASACTKGWHAFDRGEVRFFVLDTRLSRRRLRDGGVATLRQGALAAFTDWLAEDAEGGRLHCLVTSSVLLPGLVQDGNPANAGPVDTLQAAPHERAALLGALIERACGRFVLISGDYHVTLAAPVVQSCRIVGALVVAPPFYAPLAYANAVPSELWLGEQVTLPNGMEPVSVPRGQPAARGSGFALLSFGRSAAGGWLVHLAAHLTDLEAGAPDSAREWRVALPGRCPPGTANEASSQERGEATVKL